MSWIVIKDCRTDKLYIDDADGMIRNFERIIARGTKKSLIKRYPKAVIIKPA